MKKYLVLSTSLLVFLAGKINAQVGIGTTSPVTELQIYSPDESTTLTNFTQALGNGGLLIQTDYTANAYTPGLFWSASNDNNTKPKAGIFLQETGSGTYMLFGTSNSYATGITNSSTILDPSGNFGVGGTPESRFMVASTSAPKIIITPLANLTADPKLELHGNGAFSGEGFGMGYDNNVGDGYFYTTYNNPAGDISFVTQGEPSAFGGTGSERMRIDADGNVGIGTSGPATILDIEKNQNASTLITLSNTTSGTASRTGFSFVSNSGSGLLSATSSAYTGVSNWADGVVLQASAALSRGVVLFSQNGLSLQSATAGTDVMTLTSSSRVGISNTSPAVKLHVLGGSDVAVSGGGYLTLGATNTTNLSIDDNEIMARNNGAISTLHLNAEGGDVHIHSGAPTSEEVVIKDDGKVGLGTASPSEQLHVVGSIRMVDGAETAGDILTSDANGVASWVTPASLGLGGDGIYGGDGTAPSDVDVTVTDDIDFDAGTFFIDGTNNRVGIGTAAPTSKFHVNHNAQTTQAFYVDAGNMATTQTLFEHSGAATPVPFRIAKSGYAGTSATYGIMHLHLDNQNVGSGSNLHFTLDDAAGNVTEYGGIGAIISDATNTSEDGALAFYTTAGGSTRQERMRINSTGNVGIGTTAPTENLHVNAADATEVMIQSTGAESFSRLRIQNDDITYGLVVNSAENFGLYDYNAAAYRMSVTSAGNVGIGSTSPTELLHVASTGSARIRIQADTDNITESDHAQLLLEQDGSLVTALVGFSGSTNHLRIANNYVNADADIDFQTSGATRMTIDGNGNMGMGTTAPTERLHVAGSIRMVDGAETAGDIMTSDANGVASWATPASLGLGDGIYGGDGTTPSDVDVTVTDDIDFDGGTFFISGTNNRVGFGTTTPANEVEVNGWIGRSAHNNGALVGSYNNIAANGAFSNPIYVIGSNYKPSTTTLSNMYGIGYALTNSASFLTSQTVNTWGLYVAGVGVARTFFAANPNGNSYINTGGNLGINETTPELPLHVNRSGATSNSVWNSGYFVSTKTTDMADGFGTGFRFRIEDNAAVQNSIASISAIRSGADNSGLLQLGTYSAGTLNQHVYILPSGNVGFGTSTPANEVEVNGWVGRTAHELGGLVGSYNNVAANDTRSNPIYIIGSNYKPTSTTLNNMYGTGYTHTNASFVTAGTGAGWGQYIASDGDARIWFGAGAASNSYFNTTGRLGLGTDSPESKLHVFEPGEGTQNNKKTNVATAGITVETEYTDGSFTPGLFWKTSNNNPTRPKAGIYLLESSSGTSMYFGTSNVYATGITNDAMIINPTGQVGILRTPEVALDANIAASVFRLRGLAPTTDYIDFSIQGTGALLVDLTTSSGNGSAEYRTKNTTHGFLLRESDGTGTTAYSNFFVTDAATDYLSINVNNATTTSALNITEQNFVGIGTAAPTNKFEVFDGNFYHWGDAEVYQGTLHDNGGANLTNNTSVFRREIGGRRNGSTSTLFREQVRYNGDGTTRRGDYQAGVAQTSSFGGMQFRMTQTAADNSKITLMGNVGSYNPDVAVGAYSVKASNVINNTQGRNILQLDGNGTTLGLFTSAGDLGIGTTTPGGQLELSLDEGRKPGTNTWTVTSDARLKNITGAYTKGLDELDQLNPITYKYKDVGERKFAPEVLETEFVGFTAQDVQRVFPEAVGTDEDGYLNLNTHAVMVAYLNAIKELKAQNEEQKRINELQQQNIEEQKESIAKLIKITEQQQSAIRILTQQDLATGTSASK